MTEDLDHLDVLHRADQARKIERETIAPDLPDYRLLTESVDECTQAMAWIDSRHQDTDDPEQVVWLLVALTALGQAVAEVKKQVSDYLVACRPVEPDAKTGELKPVKQMEVNGVGVVEFKRDVSRKGWRNGDLWRDVRALCREHGWDEVSVLGEVVGPGDDVGPNWRVKPLRAIGIDVADYCIESAADDVSPVLPTRDLDMRGKSWEMGEAS